jgi:glycosyltransferase involved in cell wall biosynthesis
VVITKQCNLPEVQEHGCGWVIQPQVEELASALDELLRAPSRNVAEMARNGRQLVEQRYSWPVIGKQMTAVYQWLDGGLNGGILPEHVDLQAQ